MLTLTDVSAGYGRAAVLDKVSIRVDAGEVVTIIGANGAGKTTTLRAISGLIPISTGSITLDGEAIHGRGSHEVVERGVTMVPEARQLFPFMTVADNLLMGAYTPRARRQADQRLEQVLELFPRVRERFRQRAALLSGGEQQMVAIGRGLMSAPRILMFDEPSLGLAPIVVSQVFEVIDRIVAMGATVLIVEQNVFHTLKIAHRGYVLENGQVTLTGTGAELLDNPHIKKAYLGV
ncbi:ABC transporter ATP-binding protein [Azospirillum sp.]|uniref:ABC transporter ATP-binding protein n=1 Tax=Azospirillum sp. TaxID=34012 RepID=UPI002D666629|nr:ABC transporter ATP-binding protein [Azospirillum sp.]HYD70280.1 ABC transporter ATP-binding protein [Azospirillum sp.]